MFKELEFKEVLQLEYFEIDGHSFYNMVVNACNKLEEQKNFVNSLNVFPVPDGDTGTNMSMTFRGAANEIKGMNNKTVGEISKQLAKGALMGARGNSGVILSQIFRGIAKGLDGFEKVNAEEFANSILEGANSAYKAVMRPTEGTILTIVRTAGETAVKSDKKDIIGLLTEVCEESENILNKTPEMLPVLKKAKVVDAGGMGFLIILKGMLEALQNNIETSISEPVANNSNDFAPANLLEDTEIKFGYCTEFFIKAKNADLEAFKNDLNPHGDSMIVVGVDDIVKVHIHTNDPGLILSKALKLGELSKIKIDNMREQHRKILENEYAAENVNDEQTQEEAAKYAFISVAAGSGLSAIFKDLGVTSVIEGGQTMNPSTQDILNCINKINSENIFILPNNKNIIMAAEQAKQLSEKNVIVIKTKTIPQGITALTEFNAEAELDENISNMTHAIEKVKTASVTYAVRDTEMDGKTIKEGDILGIVEDSINEVGNDIYSVCEKVLENIVTDESELISIYYGAESDESKTMELVAALEEKYPDIDVQCNNGQQPLYYFIMSVE